MDSSCWSCWIFWQEVFLHYIHDNTRERASLNIQTLPVTQSVVVISSIELMNILRKKYLILRKSLSKAYESPSLHLSNKQNIGKVNHPKHKTSALRFRYKQILILHRSNGYFNRLCLRFWNSFHLPS